MSKYDPLMLKAIRKSGLSIESIFKKYIELVQNKDLLALESFFKDQSSENLIRLISFDNFKVLKIAKENNDFPMLSFCIRKYNEAIENNKASCPEPIKQTLLLFTEILSKQFNEALKKINFCETEKNEKKFVELSNSQKSEELNIKH